MYMKAAVMTSVGDAVQMRNKCSHSALGSTVRWYNNDIINTHS